MRAGYKAKGDAELLHREGAARGLLVKVLELQSASEDTQGAPEVTSSSRVRECLAKGHVQQIHKFLDRPYAVILPLGAAADWHGGKYQVTQSRWSFSSELAMNQVPGDGVYAAVVYEGAGSNVLSAGKLTVGAGQECLVELEQAVDVHEGDAGSYLRVELMSRL